MFDSQKIPGRRRPNKNVFTTKSGNSIKLNRSLGERVRAGREAKARKRAAYLSTLPRNRWKRILYRLHPKRVIKYWFSREGAIMALKITGVGIVALFLLMVGVFAYFRKDLPNIKDISGNNLGGSINYYDRTGQTLLWQDYDTVKRVAVTGDNISKYIKNATIAIEDKNFYKHGAFDVQGIARAGINDVFKHGSGGTQGGSTITQQLVKLNQDWTNDRSITRKFKELILAVELEREYSKEDILNGYLNVAPYGGVGYGAETAARDYFGVSAKDLTLAQAAMLASIPKAPDIYSPYSDNFSRKALLSRQQYVIDQMATQGMVTKQEATDAKAVDVLAQLKPPQPKYQGIKAPYFVLAAKNELEATYGTGTVKRGGWKVITTLDLGLQNTAETLVANNLKSITRMTNSIANQEATVTEDVQTGQIVALVGGVDFSNKDYGQNNYAAGVLIPPGSSFKPYDYATFIDNNNNVGAGSVLYDSEGPLPGYPCTIKGFAPPKGQSNCLKDYDNLTPGAITLRYALGGSRNIPAVKAMMSAVPNDSSDGHLTSINKVISTASAMMDNPHRTKAYNCYADEQLTKTAQCYGASAIGDGAFLHLDDHVNGLSTLARLGNAIPRTYILKITDGSNKKVYEWKQPEGKQVVKADSAYILNDMASDPNASYLPTGYKFHRYQGWNFAIKTGTTNNGFDGLMTSWSTKYAVVSWVGNNMRNKDISIGGRISMEQLTAPLTRGMMEAAHKGVKAANWTKPASVQTLPAFVITRKVSKLGESVPSPNTDLYPSWYKAPNNQGGSSQTLDKVSGKVATSCTPDAAKQTQANGNDNMFSADIFFGVKKTGNSNSSSNEPDDVHKCDDTKPSVSLSAPATCTVNAACALTVTVTAGNHDLSSDKFPGTIDLYANGQKVQSQSATGSPTTVTFSYVPTAAGSLSIEAKATDSVLYTGSESANITVQ
jgi:membrane peptidoglycan carboxypeptidase